MFSILKNIFKSKRSRYRNREIYPDEIFIDSSNLPKFDTYQFEGRLDRPISKKAIIVLGSFFVLCSFIFLSKLWILQIKEGEAYAIRSENNRLRNTPIFSNRGVIFDRNGKEISSNSINPKEEDFPMRKYTPLPGLAHILGYVKYPAKDSSGVYYQKEFVGKDGIEESYNDELSGNNGLKIVETDALGNIQSESATKPAEDGNNITLSIDSGLQSKFYEIIEGTANQFKFVGGAGIIMDVFNGEILALTSFPEYNPQILSDGADVVAIDGYLKDKRNPFLNRAVSGLYTPGSIIKPFIALGVLEEKIIDPEKKILSTGSISLPNPYFPEKKSVFTDWKAHGWVDMREALAVSSNIYFYEVGGGFGDQKGLGISNIEKYAKLFGFDSKTGINLPDESVGIIPSPTWKQKNFDNEDWRVGDTYNTSIGQYGFQITPLEAVRAVSAIANNGVLLEPTFILNNPDNNDSRHLSVSKENFKVVKEGMRRAVLFGTAKGLNMENVDIAAKTGTAELDSIKQSVNSWSLGFFPYENPKYAFVVIMEKGPHDNQIGSTYVMRQLFDWMSIYKSEYLK